MKQFLYLLLFSFVFALTKCAPMKDEDGMNFGYTNNKTMDSMNGTDTKEAIEDFQKFTNLPMTGVLDEATKKMMETPRCRMPDKKTYIFTGRWNSTHITYKFLNFPSKYYNESVTKDLMTKAMKLWLDHIDIIVEEIHDDEIDPDIHIGFVDTSQLESSEGIVIAYAAPPEDGDMFYLEDIVDYSVDFYQVAAHEFGHSLGLYHNNDTDSVMFPIFFYKDNFKLNSTDKKYVEVLYGKPYSLCRDGNIDAAFTISHTTFIIRGFQVWKYFFDSLHSGYPKLLSEEFPGLRSEVNATFYYIDSIYFLQGKQVLKFNGTFTESFDTIEQEYDAAVTIDERLYTFKGSQYWRYDIDNNGMKMLLTDYPRNISRLWRGVPGDIDAVYYDGDAHFFKGRKYYKFDTNALFIDAVEQPFSEWKGCKNNK